VLVVYRSVDTVLEPFACLCCKGDGDLEYGALHFEAEETAEADAVKMI
jgi:hypothetical protein